MRSTMPDFPLTIRHILEHGRDTYPDSQVVTATRDSARRIDFVALAARAGQLANGLARLGIGPGDRVGTFARGGNKKLFAAERRKKSRQSNFIRFAIILLMALMAYLALTVYLPRTGLYFE